MKKIIGIVTILMLVLASDYETSRAGTDLKPVTVTKTLVFADTIAHAKRVNSDTSIGFEVNGIRGEPTIHRFWLGFDLEEADTNFVTAGQADSLKVIIQTSPDNSKENWFLYDSTGWFDLQGSDTTGFVKITSLSIKPDSLWTGSWVRFIYRVTDSALVDSTTAATGGPYDWVFRTWIMNQ